MKTASLPLHQLLSNLPLSANQWESSLSHLFRGSLDRNGSKSLLLLSAKRREDDLALLWGCLRAVRRFESLYETRLPGLMDLCGTGGDGKRTFNISTLAGLVVAGADCYVAKHGNRAVSSRAGSSDLMEALGVRLELPAPRMLEVLRQCHFGYFHAPFYHPSFSRVQSLRRELGIQTIFNLTGPLLNPVALQYQMVGVSDPSWLTPLAEISLKLGRIRSAIFHSQDGLDELSPTAPNDILLVEGGGYRRLKLDPRKLGLARSKLKDFEGGDLTYNRDLALGILKGGIAGPKQDIVVLNSGFALWLTGQARTLQEGIMKSRWVIRSGRAFEVLTALRKLTQRKSKT